MTLPDVQNTSSQVKRRVPWVGVEGVKHPVYVFYPSLGYVRTPATLSVYCSLTPEVRGINMSRTVEVVYKCFEKQCLLVDNVVKSLDFLKERLGSADGFVKVTLDYFVEKTSPRSMIKQFLPITTSVVGICESSCTSLLMIVKVPYTSCCPCSKEIADGKGAHNQRSFASVALINPKGTVLFEHIVNLVEECASAPVFELLKRPDEKHVTVEAYENPKFVEDMVRAISDRLLKNPVSDGFWVKVEHQESIHVHQAVAFDCSDRVNAWWFLQEV